jgi:UDPglucose 6-dehydrogenase
LAERVLVIGLWHLGCVTAAGLASLGVPVIAYDEKKEVVEQLKRGQPPIFEPGLAELIAKDAAAGKLEFTSDLAQAMKTATVVYITIDTPVDTEDAADLSPIIRAFDAFLPLLHAETLVIISSQVPVGTCDGLLQNLKEHEKTSQICYTPENLRLGEAFKGFFEPERTVFGLSSADIQARVADLFKGVSGEKFFMDLKSAEMVKHALNAYLATMISWSAEVSDVCERTGADAVKVMGALRAEKRVSRFAPIMPGLGFGGGTLARDVQFLRAFGRQHRLKTPLLDAVMDVNTRRMLYVKERLTQLLGSLRGKRVTFLGLTYKAGTDTLRRSLALQVIEQLAGADTELRAFDPMVQHAVADHSHLRICATIEEAFRDADAVVITTDWPEFKTLDYPALGSSMRTPIVLDAKNMLKKEDFARGKVRYYGIGR